MTAGELNLNGSVVAVVTSGSVFWREGFSPAGESFRVFKHSQNGWEHWHGPCSYTELRRCLASIHSLSPAFSFVVVSQPPTARIANPYQQRNCEKVLVIDEDYNARKTLWKTLKQAGYRVVIAPDGERGYHFICAEMPDLVLASASAPLISGIEVLSLVNRDNRFRDLPVYITCGTQREVDQAKSTGATGIILKPIDAECLLLALQADGRMAGQKVG